MTTALRILTWNIRAGGGERLPRIAEALALHDADVLVLTEYRSGNAGQRLRAVLRDQGYAWLSPIEPPGIRNGVLIATRRKPRLAAHVTEHVPEPWRMLAVTVGNVRLFGIYMPNLRAKIPYWEALIEASTSHAGGRALAVGDFNTCRAYVDEPGATDVTALFMDKIQAAGYRDVWRDRFPDGREYSWYSHRGNGFRIDHAFASAAMTRRISSVRYSHHERTSGLSDHSALLVEIDVRAALRLPLQSAAASLAPPPENRAAWPGPPSESGAALRPPSHSRGAAPVAPDDVPPPVR